MRESLKRVSVAVAAAGAISLAGSAVAHAAPLLVPDVSGMTVLEATETLNDAGFDNVFASTPDPTDEVLGTNYDAGTFVDEDTTILLVTPTR
ncbi:PASTA domain-containing protein [Rhodococcoides yunnanense]|uniref:PASTA domain-containing protein n=1 Tax=Rhodococcoides yunnanense TaxID=278209 RepID=UPI0014760BF2|nr:PASTA domain-containing protein [Rhodococcus yunnanensis]